MGLPQGNMNLEVYTNSEVHLVLQQSLSIGQQSLHTPEVPVSHLAVILHGPQALHTYLKESDTHQN